MWYHINCHCIKNVKVRVSYVYIKLNFKFTMVSVKDMAGILTIDVKISVSQKKSNIIK